MSNNWIFEDKIVDQLPEWVTGFVYQITNTVNGRMYIGKKLARFKKSRKPLKGRVNKRRYTVDSDWKEYFGSSDELNADIKKFGKSKFKREILFYCNCVNTSIQNIYVTGFVYERCVRDRPVGIIELNNCKQSNMFINKQNIFLQTDLVQRQDNKPIEPSKIEWQYIDGNKYLYTDPIP